MNLAYAFLAHSADFSSDGKLYVIGGDFDTIRAGSFPAMHPFMVVVVKLVASPSDFGHEHKLVVRLVTPDGTQLVEAEIPVQLPADAGHREPKVGLLANLLGATFAAPGDHAVVVEVDGKEMCRLPLHVIQVD
jgi:hypothetical protein